MYRLYILKQKLEIEFILSYTLLMKKVIRLFLFLTLFPIMSSAQITDSDPEVTVTFKDVQPIFEKRCSGCHANLDAYWSNYEFMYERREDIYLRVVVYRSMPLYSKMPEEERNLIKQWINQGSPR